MVQAVEGLACMTDVKQEPIEDTSSNDFPNNVTIFKDEFNCRSDIIHVDGETIKQERPDDMTTLKIEELPEDNVMSEVEDDAVLDSFSFVNVEGGCWSDFKQEPICEEFDELQGAAEELDNRTSIKQDAFLITRDSTSQNAREMPNLQHAMNIYQETQCSRCGMSFNNTLNLHLKYECGKHLRCLKCGKLYKRQINLYTHTTLDCGKNYQCQRCNKVFSRKRNLDQHNFICSITVPNDKGAERLLSSNSSPPALEEISQFDCPDCNRVFTRQKYLDFHINNDCRKLYTCNSCGNVYTNVNSYKKHTKYDCGKQHKCVTCNREFQARASLRRHTERWKHNCAKKTFVF